MKTSQSGRALIEQREGRRLTAYRDARGIWTIGVGHTGRMTPPLVTPGMTIGAVECDAMLAADLEPVEAAINGAVRVPLSQDEFDALASLGFNIGATALARSTVVKRLNLGDVAGAADAFLMWDRPSVLIGRRLAEKAQFLSKGTDATAVKAARAATLTTQADAAKGKAVLARSGTAALVAAGATAVTTGHAHHQALAFAAAAILLVLAVGAAIVAVASGAAARALAANADRTATPRPSASPATRSTASLKP